MWRKKWSSPLWIFECICGKRKKIIKSNVTKGRTRSCGCRQKELTEMVICRPKKPPGIACRHQLFLGYRQGARTRRMSFQISEKFFAKITKQKCHYCDVPPVQITGRPKYQPNLNGDYVHNGIDRLNPNIGYIPKNCVPCCKRCNYAKKNMSVDEFLDWILQIRKSLSKTILERERKSPKCPAMKI